MACSLGCLAIFVLALLSWKRIASLCLWICAKVSPIDLRSYGKWAIITGASDGIGRAYALALAKRGLNIMVIARRETMLKEVCAEAKKKYKVEAKYIAFDFASGDYDQFKKDLEASGALSSELALLMNNVGMAETESFHDLATSAAFPAVAKRLERFVKVNCLAVTCMSAMVLPIFYRKKKGIVVSTSAMAVKMIDVPFMGLYGGSKCFTTAFSEAANAECQIECPGVIFQNIQPAGVQTAMYEKESGGVKLPPIDACHPTPEQFVEQAIPTIGWLSSTSGCMAHSAFFGCLVTFLMKIIPSRPRNKQVYKLHQSLKAKAP